MTVPATPRRAGPFNGNGVTTSFPFSFKTFDEADIAVVFVDTDGLETTLVLNSGYSVTLNPDQEVAPGGAVTYPVSGTPLALGETLSIVGALPYDQVTDLPTGGSYRAQVVENAFDRTEMQIQQLAEIADRTLTLPASVDPDDVSAQLPTPEAFNVIGWNETATALQNFDPSTFATIVAFGTARVDLFSGDGVETEFVLTDNPGVLGNLDVAVDGVTQRPGADFTWDGGTTLTFIDPPPAGTDNVLARYMQGLPQGVVDPNSLTFSHAAAYDQGTVGLALQTAINPLNAPYNALGDGVADDTAALVAAEADAFAQGLSLFLPSGTVFNFNGFFVCRVNVSAYGATLKQIRAGVSGANAAGLFTVGAGGVVVAGLTVDAQLKSTGVAGDGMSNVTLRDCRANNCVNLGFGFYGGTHVEMVNCRTSNTRYSTTGVVGGAADGFFFGGCTRSSWLFCRADDFRRIGFVADGNGAVKCAQITTFGCIATNANNCDDSLTEYNAGFWYENTNSGDLLYCIASSIAGNAGQTSGRVTGLWALGVGNDSHGTINVIGCRVFGGTGYLPSGITAGGSGTFAETNIVDCYVNKARTGIASLCGMGSLSIRNLTLDDVVNTNGSQGGIVIDSAGGVNLLPVLEIDKIVTNNCIWHADAGIVNFFSAPTACKYTLRNVKGNVPHVTRGYVARVRVEECEIACGSSSGFGSFGGSYCEFIDSHLTSRNTIFSDAIVQASALPASAEVIFRGGSITGYAAPGWNMEFGGVDITLRCFGLKTTQFTFAISTTGTFINRFDTCDFFGVLPATGAIRTNFNAPTKQVLIVQNCYFESANIADTPIRLWNTAPTNAVLQGNTRRTATVLHNLGAVTSDVNNVVV